VTGVSGLPRTPLEAQRLLDRLAKVQTPVQRVKLAQEALAVGASAAEVGQVLDIDASTVRRHFQHEAPPGPRLRADVDVALIVQLKLAGASIKAIAVETGYSRNTVMSRLAAVGLSASKLRRRGLRPDVGADG
jgi:DNA-directed RNA polymerase specialized sigma24 family protein